jgi:hypothetical protein
MKIESAFELTTGCHYGTQRNSNRKRCVPWHTCFFFLAMFQILQAVFPLRLCCASQPSAAAKLSQKWRGDGGAGHKAPAGQGARSLTAMGQTGNGASHGVKFVSPMIQMKKGGAREGILSAGQRKNVARLWQSKMVARGCRVCRN